jgi:hypothetical protein
MDTRNFIIKEFGLPEDVGFDKFQRLTYGEIEELLTKFDKVRREECTIPVVSGSLPLVSDKDIEAWADRVQPARGGYKSDYIFSAKAMRDGKIKASVGKQ